MKVSVVILAWNGIAYLKDCLDSVLAQNYLDVEIIVVDNASVDGSAQYVAEFFPQVRIIQNENNLGFAGGMNIGTEVATGDVIIWLNQDTVVKQDWLQAIVETFDNYPDVGVVGCKIFEADSKTLHHAGGSLDILSGESHHFGAGEPDVGQYDNSVDIEYVTGAAMAVRRQVINKVGLLDERFFPGYYEDADYCVRVRQAGYKVRYVPQAVVIHHISTSTSQQWYRQRFYYYRNRLLFLLKYLSVEDFQLRFFPEELHRLKTLSRSELPAIQLALSEILSREEGQTVFKSLNGLYNMVSWLRSTPPNLKPIQDALSQTRNDRYGLIGVAMPVLEEMESAWKIKDQPFHSNMPVIGHLVVLFREIWNSVSAKWYTLALFNQQTRFNRLLNQVIRTVIAYIWDNDTMLSLLEERYGHLEQRIALLESKQASGEK